MEQSRILSRQKLPLLGPYEATKVWLITLLKPLYDKAHFPKPLELSVERLIPLKAAQSGSRISNEALPSPLSGDYVRSSHISKYDSATTISLISTSLCLA